MTDKTAILIAGPTAGGKSALALEHAERLGGVIINADSMQVYRELHLLTARPSAEDEARAPHWLYGHVAGIEGYSAGRFCIEAGGAIAKARAEGLVPIIVGGTGLYFKALLEGLSPIPDIPDGVRNHWREEAARLGAPALHEVLKIRDPDTADRLPPGDSQRIIRALEVVDGTGEPLSYWQRQPGTPVLEEAGTERLVVLPHRAELYRRCDLRFDQMLAAGALDEARALMQLGVDPALPVMRALGVRPLIEHLQGKSTLNEAAERAKTETRQFAKRQLTWLRKNMMSWSVHSQQ